jgi:hypothetical protein
MGQTQLICLTNDCLGKAMDALATKIEKFSDFISALSLEKRN